MIHTKFLTNLQILVIDDEELIRTSLTEFIKVHGGQAFSTASMHGALEVIEKTQFDLILCDIYLNGEGSSLGLIDQINSIDPDLSTIYMTGYSIEDLASKIIMTNVYSVIQKPFNFCSLSLLMIQASRNTRQNRQNRYYSSRLQASLSDAKIDRDKIFINTLSSLSNALEHKDEYTRNHSEIVSAIANKIAWEFTDDTRFISDVTIAGKLHDLGKIGIQDSILFKKSSLTDDEYGIIKMHPEMSYKIVKPVDTIGKISSYVLHHHEHYDGTGYPHKLSEKGIPAGSRIIAVADAFNAITSNRPYRNGVQKEKAIEILFESANKFHDLEIVEILFKLVKSGRITTENL